MPKDSALELLSPELQHHILLQSESIESLHTLICASPRLYQIFRLNKETILSTVALCQFHPTVQSEAVAIAKMEQIPHQSISDTATSFCATFPHQIHRWRESDAFAPVSTDLCKLDRDIKFFVGDYARNTLPIMDQLGQSLNVEILPEYQSHNYPLKTTEVGRLQRAFCRFELYRHLFSRCSQDFRRGIHQCIISPPLSTAKRAELFLRNLPAFQIAEIACIRDYLFRRLRGIYDELENEAVQTMPVEAMTFDPSDEAAMWRSPFYLFTTHAQHQQGHHLEHLLSLGLPYIRRILESTGDEQRDTFLHHVRGHVVGHLETDFMSKALYFGLRPIYIHDSIHDHNPWLSTKKEMTPGCDENGYSELPQGWLWGHQHLEPQLIVDHVYKGFRDWGYVFWDYDRLHQSGILRRKSVTPVSALSEC